MHPRSMRPLRAAGALSLMLALAIRHPLEAGERASADDGGAIGLEALKGMSRAARSASDHREVIRAYLSSIGRILVLGRKDAAAATDLASASSRALKCPWAESRIEAYRALLRTSRNEIDEAARARSALLSDPRDLAARRTLARFRCLFLGEWEECMADLALGASALAQAAGRDLLCPTDPAEQRSLADVWAALAEAEKGIARRNLWERAAAWYAKARDGASGSEREAIEKLLAKAPATYLADEDEVEAWVGWDRFRKDGTCDGSQGVLVNGARSRKALFLHPPTNGFSRALYRLGKRYRSLQAHVAIADIAGTRFRSRLCFQVWGDGRLLWASKDVVGPGRSQACSVDVTGIDALELRVECKGDYTWASAAWLDPRVESNGSPGPAGREARVRR